MRQLTKTERRLRIASLLVGAGLIVALISMVWNHPLSFILFLFAGLPIGFAGTLLYLLTIVRSRPDLR